MQRRFPLWSDRPILAIFRDCKVSQDNRNGARSLNPESLMNGLEAKERERMKGETFRRVLTMGESLMSSRPELVSESSSCAIIRKKIKYREQGGSGRTGKS